MRESGGEKREGGREKEEREAEDSEKGTDRTSQCREYVARAQRVREDRKSCNERCVRREDGT